MFKPGTLAPGPGVLCCWPSSAGGCADVPCAPRSIPGFNGSEDCTALEQLLEGYDQQDQDQVAEVCNSPLFKYMDNDVSAFSRPSLPLPCSRKVSPSAVRLELLLREEAHDGCALPGWPAAGGVAVGDARSSSICWPPSRVLG